MGERSVFKPGLGLIVVSVLILAAAVFFSYRTYSMSRRAESSYINSIQEMKNDIKRVDSGLEKLNKIIIEIKESNQKKPESGIGIGNSEIKGRMQDSRIDSLSSELRQLKQVMKSTGLEKLAESGAIDAGVFQEIYDRHVQEKEINAYREELREINLAQHQSDEERYGEELKSLYSQARFTRRGGTDEGQQESAFNELVSRYPDSYSAAMAIAQRAIIATFRRDLDRAEEYYNMLRNISREGSQDVVLDMGIEALPAVEYSLAMLYYREGRINESRVLTRRLEETRQGSLVFMRSGRGGPPSLRPVSEAVDRLYRLIGSAR